MRRRVLAVRALRLPAASAHPPRRAGAASGGRDAGRKQYGTPFCGSTSNGRAGAAFYTQGGVPDPACAAGDVANPYWNAPPQSLLDPNGKYLPYSIIPGGIGTGRPLQAVGDALHVAKG